MGKHKEGYLSSTPLMSEEEQKELYLYTLKKAANENSDQNKVQMTNLYNIRSFYYLGNELRRQHTELKYAVIRLDIYRFKTVNELCGRNDGDKLLVYIADLLRAYESKYSVISHMRADIFAMLIPYKKKSDLIKIVTHLKKKIDRYPIECEILPAFGICIDNQADISLMDDYANLALQNVKGKVYAFYSFYNPNMRENLLDEKKIENQIADAIQNRELKVYIQPKVEIATGEIIGGEALIRWIHPIEGMISPDRFIPVLEKNGYIINVDLYIWEQVMIAIHRWLSNHTKMYPISVNVSRLHAYQRDFIPKLKNLCKQYEVNPALLPLEVTESAFTKDTDYLFKCVEELQESGFPFSMDDFGSGYSSLNMLKDEPVDEVKIDRSFVKDIEKSDKSRIVVKNVINMLGELHIDMIAEGVETEEQARLLYSYGCKRAQGYYYYKPMPIEDFFTLLQEQEIIKGEVACSEIPELRTRQR